MSGECSGILWCSIEPCRRLVGGHGGSVGRGARWQRNTKGGKDNLVEWVEKELWSLPVTPIGQLRSREGEEGRWLQWRRRLPIWGKLE